MVEVSEMRVGVGEGGAQERHMDEKRNISSSWLDVRFDVKRSGGRGTLVVVESKLNQLPQVRS
jgi:hypothetical protein